MKQKKVLAVGIVLVLTILLVGSALAAMGPHQQEVYNNIDDLWSKLKYGFQHGAFIFTTWGQTNCCALYPQSNSPVPSSCTGVANQNGGTVLIYPTNQAGKHSVSCSDASCGYNKCAIDLWWGYTAAEAQAQQGYGTEITSGTWSNPGNLFYFAEIYCCPQNPTPLPDHTTKVYTCNPSTGTFSYTTTVSKGTEGWCADADDNNYRQAGSSTGSCRASASEAAYLCPAPPVNTCISNPDEGESLGLSSCTYQTSQMFDTSSLPKTITSSSTQQKEYLVYKRCQDTSGTWRASDLLTSGVIDKGQSKTFSYTEQVRIYILEYQCNPAEVCKQLGESCTQQSDCCNADTPQISCSNSKCTWQDENNTAGKYCINNGGNLMDSDYWKCKGSTIISLEIANHEVADNILCCLGGTEPIEATGSGKPITLSKYFSISSEDFVSEYARACKLSSDCSSIDGYKTTCETSGTFFKSAQTRIENHYQDNCKNIVPGGIKILSYIFKYVALGAPITTDDICNYYGTTWKKVGDWWANTFTTGTGICVARSTTWYGQLWETVLLTVAGFGIPANYVLLTTIVIIFFAFVLLFQVLQGALK